jgi:hypothetical protein
MARTVTVAPQTAKSLEHFAAYFEEHARALRGAAQALAADPPIESVEVKNESTRDTGMEYISNWVHAATHAAFTARAAVYSGSSQKPSVRQTDSRSPNK